MSVYRPQTKENSRGAVDSAEKVGVGVVELLTETTATARPFAKDGGVKPLRNRARSSTGRPAQTMFEYQLQKWFWDYKIRLKFQTVSDGKVRVPRRKGIRYARRVIYGS